MPSRLQLQETGSAPRLGFLLVVMKSEIVGGFCVCLTDHLLWAHGGRKTLLTLSCNPAIPKSSPRSSVSGYTFAKAEWKTGLPALRVPIPATQC